MGRAPRTKETLPDFLKWRRVTRHPLVFRELTGSQRTPRVWGVTLEIRTTIASTAHTQYDQVVEAAVRVERSMGLKSQATPSQGHKRSGSTWVQEVPVSSPIGEERHSGPVAAGPVKGHSLARVQ